MDHRESVKVIVLFMLFLIFDFLDPVRAIAVSTLLSSEFKDGSQGVWQSLIDPDYKVAQSLSYHSQIPKIHLSLILINDYHPIYPGWFIHVAGLLSPSIIFNALLKSPKHNLTIIFLVFKIYQFLFSGVLVFFIIPILYCSLLSQIKSRYLKAKNY